MVYIMLAEGFEESEAIVPADLLRRAGIETAFVSVEPGLVRGSHGICVQADLTFGQIDLSRADMPCHAFRRYTHALTDTAVRASKKEGGYEI